jgi:hypothetical protein
VGDYSATDSFSDCKFDYNDEEIIPIKGDLTFDGDYEIVGRKTFVVMN